MLTPKEAYVEIKAKRKTVSPVSYAAVEKPRLFKCRLKISFQQFLFFISFMNTCFIKLSSNSYFVCPRIVVNLNIFIKECYCYCVPVGDTHC